MQLLPFLALIAGIIMGFGWFPQAWKVYKTKKVKDISLITLVLYFPSLLTMTLYGISLKDIPITLSSGLGTLAVGSILVEYYRYK